MSANISKLSKYACTCTPNLTQLAATAQCHASKQKQYICKAFDRQTYMQTYVHYLLIAAVKCTFSSNHLTITNTYQIIKFNITAAHT